MPPKHPIKSALDFIRAREMDHLSFRQMRVLLACAEGKQTVRGLSSLLKISKPAITRAANKLVGLNFLNRTSDPDDGRSVLLSLTKTGQKFAANFE